MKHKKFLRGCVGVLCLLTLTALTWLPAAALTPSYTPSSAYRASTYYKNLKALPLTGDGAFDTLSVALSQYGYHEGSKLADLGGGNRAGAGNYTEYNFALGKINGSYAYAWCASFVSFCLSQAGEEASAGGAFASCTLWVEHLQKTGAYRTRSSGYLPKMGDLIFFRSAGVARASDHVGLVRYVANGRVYTVEGNSSGQVSLRSYALSDSYIVGYGLPAYHGGARGIDRRAAEDRAEGWYAVTYDFLNLRATRAASGKKLGQLKRGELVYVRAIREGWGRVEHNGISAYISLEYADFVAPVSHKVRYVSEGKTLLERSYFSTEQARVSAFIPEREGYVFLTWEGAEGESYAASQPLPRGDVTLTARFEPLPPPVPVLPPAEELPTEPTEESPPVFNAPSDPSQPEQISQPRTLAARRHAGVVSALLALTAAFFYLTLRRREE